MSETTNEVLIVVVYGTIILLIVVVVLISFLFIFQKRQFSNQQEKQRIHDQYEREILKTQLEVQEQTHQQISRDIHDNVGQVLAVVRLYLKGLGDHVKDESSSKRIAETDELVGGAITDLRNLAHSLSSEQLKTNGLIDVLRREVERIERTGKIETKFECSESHVEIEDEIELVLFRMCQELLANVIKHSEAGMLSLEIQTSNDELQLVIADNGKGFDMTGIEGNGLFNLYRRAELIGAKVELNSRPGVGTTAVIRWKKGI